MSDENKEPKVTMTFDKSATNDLYDMLEVKGKCCQSCGKKLTVKNWAGFIYSKPICKNTICMMDVVFEHHRKEKNV